jgi:hypothetical protein
MISYVKPRSPALPYSLASTFVARADAHAIWGLHGPPASIDSSNVRAKCHE